MSDKNLKTSDDFEKLEWIRIFDPVHIPLFLIEQVRDRDWSAERFIKYQKTICFNKQPDGNLHINPLNLLFVLVDGEKKVHGFLWASIDTLSNALVINTFSMEKEWWHAGEAVKLLERKAKEIAKGAQLDKIYWITNYPKHSERYGFKRSKSILMEYVMEEDHGENFFRRGCQTDRLSESVESDSATVSAKHFERTGS